MAAYNINGKCESCANADSFGMQCTYGDLFPVLWLMASGDMFSCPNFKKKSLEQLEAQYEERKHCAKGDEIF